jgi:hypothetical protein
LPSNPLHQSNLTLHRRHSRDVRLGTLLVEFVHW